MASRKEDEYVFIVRIRFVPREIRGARPELRGQVESLHSGKRHYVRDLDEISPLIAAYLEESGVQPSPGCRLGRWLKWLKGR